MTALIPLSILLASLSFIRMKSMYKNLFPFLLVASGIYYSVFGFLYWTIVEQGYFVGFNWSASLLTSATLFAFAIFLTCVSYYFFLTRKNFSYEFNLGRRVESAALYPFLILGFFSCLFVVLNRSGRGAFFLIAYQFSDLAIAALLYASAMRPGSKFVRILILIFFAYCLFVGFRYKIILLAFPLWILGLVRSKGGRRLLLSTAVPLGIIALFTIITITRVKFSGLELDQAKNADASQLIYGLLAETNILFGVSSITTYVLPHGDLIYLSPIRDALLELLPRFLFPDRETGAQIFAVLEGLQTDEGYNSATTYPFFGEYLLMFGYPGYFIGCLFFGYVVAKLVGKISKGASRDVVWTGCALIAVLFGYYYVSRGYFPQFFKSVVFILIPFFVMARGLGLRYQK